MGRKSWKKEGKVVWDGKIIFYEEKDEWQNKKKHLKSIFFFFFRKPLLHNLSTVTSSNEINTGVNES